MKYTSNVIQIMLIHPVVSAGEGEGLRSWIALYIEMLIEITEMQSENISKDCQIVKLARRVVYNNAFRREVCIISSNDTRFLKCELFSLNFSLTPYVQI